MADALPVLEVEHELCSANLPSFPHVAESAIDQALEALHLRATTPVLDQRDATPASELSVTPTVLEQIPVQSESSPVCEPLPEPVIPSEPQSRRSPRPAKRLQSKPSQRLFDALRSRRLRIIATAVGMLFVVGLVGLNWQRSNLPKSDDELAETDLFEFQDDIHIGKSVVGQTSEHQLPGEITESDMSTVMTRSTRPEMGERLPPVSQVNHSEQRWPSAGIQSIGISSQSAKRGSQAAWLTGQIEIESLDTPQDDSVRRSNGRDAAR